MTDDQFERIKKGLNFHSEGGVYNLCTLTETALREIIEDAVKFYEKQQKIDAEQIRALQKQNGELTDKVKELERKIASIRGCHRVDLAKLKARTEQVERLKNENAELKQAKEGKVVEHFEAYGQCRDSRRIAELEAQIEKMQEKLKADLIAKLEEQMQYSTSPSCTKGMELFIKSIKEWEIKEKPWHERIIIKSVDNKLN